jgi:hypothetical protein
MEGKSEIRANVTFYPFASEHLDHFQHFTDKAQRINALARENRTGPT